MNLHIFKWGKSFAILIPAEFARRLGVREGDTLDAQLTIDGGFALRSSSWRREAFAVELAAARVALPLGTAVVDGLRRKARY